MSDDTIEREMLLLETIEQHHHPHHNHHHHHRNNNNNNSHHHHNRFGHGFQHLLKQMPNGDVGGRRGGTGTGGGGGGGPNHRDQSEHFTQDLVRQVNMHNFKLLAIILVAVFIFYHGYLNSFYG